ncbi:LysM peptidoglycan-binding domain-containing protein [Moraxella nasovis]|uniref:LysM peptidoglycan-binding domain-containing protein n=1 Tax=Moraxella nasovis TaxID=2904121 RepID=UPI001F60DA47|nr:LysM domain-containing protein [Moraxella nasovis]UNU72887.1 LysM peptidoglycan-binding domain-containing protein [Moraxella nasovis]
MISKQVVLGLVLIVGGGVLAFALSQEGDHVPNKDVPAVKTEQTIVRPVVEPLTADAETEKRVLAERQKQREKREALIELETNALLSEQERARVEALAKAKAETNGGVSVKSKEISVQSAEKSEVIAAPTVQTRPEVLAAAVRESQRAREQQKAEAQAQAKKDEAKKAETKQSEPKKTEPKKQDNLASDTNKSAKKDAQKTKAEQNSKPVQGKKYEVADGDNLTRIARQYGISVTALAEANNMRPSDALWLGRTIVIPSASQVNKLEEKAAKRRVQANKDKPIQNKPKPEKNTDKADKAQDKNKTKSTAIYSVQVALSPDKQKIDDVVREYRAAGYKVSTSQTSRGIRVLVDSKDSYDDANALRSKIAADDRVKSEGAFVKKMEK